MRGLTVMFGVAAMVSAAVGQSDDGEFLIDTVVRYVPAPYYQQYAAAAFDGTNFLVVWADQRAGSYDICGARMAPDGTVLDIPGIVISDAPSWQRSPAVSFDGTNFLVVWADSRNGGGRVYEVFGARVSSAGVVLDPEGIRIPGSYGAPALAFDGANYLVVWEHPGARPPDGQIYGTRVSPAGVVLDTAGIAITRPTLGQGGPAAAFDGANFLVVWHDWRNGSDWDIYGARVTSEGVVLDTAGIAISTASGEQSNLAISSNGTNCLVAWEDWRNGSPAPYVYAARVARSGTVLDPQGIEVSRSAGDQGPAVCLSGANFLVAWDDERNQPVDFDVYAARISPAGAVLDTAGFAISAAIGYNQTCPALACGGVNVLAVWTDERSGLFQYDIYGARVTPEGTVPDSQGVVISLAADLQWDPAASFDGENFLVTWQDWRGGYDIAGARVTPLGVVLDPDGIVISAGAWNHGAPTAACDGTNFLVVWEDRRNGEASDIYGARVTPAGVVLDTAGFVISAGGYDHREPALAFDGDNFLVAWTRDDYVFTADVYAARVSRAGVVLDTLAIVVSTADYDQRSPALVFDGSNFLVVWSDSRRGLNQEDIYGARITPQGTVLDPAGFVIAEETFTQLYPALAFDGTNSLVVWEDPRNGDGYDVYGARVSRSGFVLDPLGIQISAGADDEGWPAVAFDGTDYVVVWTDDREGSCDIYGARVTTAGAVFDSGPVVRQEGRQRSPALARGADNQMFLAYQGWAGTVGGKTYNTDRIWGRTNANVDIAETANSRLAMANGSTIVRGVLRLPPAASLKPQAPGSLLDAAGRKVMELVPGANDVRHLAPGVYFVSPATCEKRDASRVAKVVVTE